jgi:hypothetical protein
MDSTRYVQIICSACGGKIVAVIGQPRPATCALCKEPLEPLPPPSGNGRQTETGTRGPATFSRGTFKNTGSKKPPSANRPSLGAPKASGAPPSIADLKKKFLSLFTPRS